MGCIEKWADFEVRSISEFQITGVDNAGVDAVVLCELVNPNPVDARIRDIQFVARSGNERLGIGRLAGPVVAKSKQPFTLKVPVRIVFADLPSDFPRRVAKARLPLTVEATFKAETPLGIYHLRLRSRGRTVGLEHLRIAMAGKFRSDALWVEKIRLGKATIKGVRLSVALGAKNALPFAVKVNRATVSLDINGSPFGKTTLAEPVHLRSAERTQLTVEVVATHGAVGRALGAMLGSDPRFRIRGTLWIDPIAGISKIPFDLEADSSVFQ